MDENLEMSYQQKKASADPVVFPVTAGLWLEVQLGFGLGASGGTQIQKRTVMLSPNSGKSFPEKLL